MPKRHLRMTAEDRAMLETARKLRASMKQALSGITDAADAAGKLMAILDNDAGIETLSSPRSDRCYQLFGELQGAYNDVADFFRNLM